MSYDGKILDGGGDVEYHIESIKGDVLDVSSAGEGGEERARMIWIGKVVTD